MSSETITRNDLKNILDAVLPTTVGGKVIVPTFTNDVTNPVGTIVEAQILKIGNICHLVVGVKHTSAVSVGGNVYHGKLSQYRPKQLSNGVGYYGSSCGVMQLLDSGELTVRITGAQLAANSTIYCSLAYITS